MRIRQWVKNVFVFLPLFFSGGILNGGEWIASILAAAAFCLASSAVYCLNDVLDFRADREHPVKRLRPVASGAVSPRAALILAALCVAGAFAPAFLPRIFPFAAIEESITSGASKRLALIIGIYLLLNAAYCIRIKHIALIDVFTIAIGYVLRVLAGGAMTGIRVSPWLICMTYLLALFLAFGKRRDDVLNNERGETVTRRHTLSFNRPFLDITLGVLSTVAIVSYVMYCMSPEVMKRLGSDCVYVTAVFVLLGMIRYLQLAIVEGRSGAPTDIVLKDGMIRFAVIGWIISYAIILYF
ncbi:MAG: UbiA prenyltransferase family protein [Muribaculaceae bacterium]|nr:UbiA prenyltransferase family protein [Muribaculaceae bacterium]